MTRAVVFAYHNVGVRCLKVLLAHGVDVPLVVTHADSPAESIWFESVAALAALHGLEVAMPGDSTSADFAERIEQLAPDFLFSFYYRQMLPLRVLVAARSGAYNMHGSMLPKYRGRVPVNWAILHGETVTGATLHRMVEKPDAGAIVDQQPVPILPDDTALEVFHKVTWAAELVLDRSLPGLLAGTAPHREQRLEEGSYFGGRRPEHGRIDWRQGANAVHNLIRAVAPPYPGAFTEIQGSRARVLGSHLEARRTARAPGPGLYAEGGALYAECADGGVLRVLALEIDGAPVDADQFIRRYGAAKTPLPVPK